MCTHFYDSKNIHLDVICNLPNYRFLYKIVDTAL